MAGQENGTECREDEQGVCSKQLQSRFKEDIKLLLMSAAMQGEVARQDRTACGQFKQTSEGLAGRD